MENLFPLFEDKALTFVVDSGDVFEYLVGLGFVCVHYNKNMKLPSSSVCVQTSRSHFNFLKDNVELSPESRILTLPLIAFENSLNSVKYFFSRLRECDFKKIFLRYNNLISSLNGALPKFSIEMGSDNILHCKLADKVKYSYPKQLLLQSGNVRSVAQFFEVNFNHLYPEHEPDFLVDGKFSFKSCLYAIHPTNIDITKEQKTLALELFKKINSAKNPYFIIKNNKAVELNLDGTEHLENLKKIAGNIRSSDVTELAFGLNDCIFNSIDWNINSQINEGCSGIHLGFGDGKTGIHMDFICPVSENNLKIYKV